MKTFFLKSFIGRFVLLSAVLTFGVCDSARGDIAVFNAWTNTVLVSGAVILSLGPGGSYSFTPSSSATNTVTFTGSGRYSFPLVDGTLYSVGPSGGVMAQSVLRSGYDDDSVLAGYFTNGLELGTGSAVVLFGILAIRKALRLGDYFE